METKYIYYNFNNSLKRIDEILDSSDNNYEERAYIPSRSSLTFKNGFYVDVAAVFVDIRDSSNLVNQHRRPTLAKIYRVFISEVVAIMNDNIYCEEVNIVGDCVSGIFDVGSKYKKEQLIETIFKINGIINVLNCKFTKKDITNIKVGIGIDYGRALMIKAGYKGSEINEIVWMGNVVNNASNLGKKANKYYTEPILISIELYDLLPIENKILFNKNEYLDVYESNEIDASMEDWLQDNCSE